MTVLAVHASEGGSEVDLICDNGEEVHIALDADCCSESYFDADSLADMRSLVGQTLQSIDDVETDAPASECRQDEQTVHCLKITTDARSISCLWRNRRELTCEDSNGYYDGRCNVSVRERQ